MDTQRLLALLPHFGFIGVPTPDAAALRRLAGPAVVMATIEAGGRVVCHLPKLLTEAVIAERVNVYQDKPLRLRFVGEGQNGELLYDAHAAGDGLEAMNKIAQFLKSGFVQAFLVAGVGYVFSKEMIDVMTSGDEASVSRVLTASLQSDDVQLLNYAGKLRLSAGEVDAAAKCFVDACAKEPLFAEAFSNMGTLMWQMEQKDQAFELFSESLVRNPADESAQDNFIQAGVELQAWNKMETTLNTCQKHYGEYDGLAYLKALILLKMGKVSEGRELALALLQKSPDELRYVELVADINSGEA